jgi:5-methylcytosine-specific restriction endonuclease McrA
MRKICQTVDCKNLAKPNGYKKNGDRKYYKWCSSCCKKRYKDSYKLPKEKEALAHVLKKQREYGGYIKLPYCEICGFKPDHYCQLDVDHKDGNHRNNDQDNLQTLCANCHRLKTWKNKDAIKTKPPIRLE